MRIKTTGWRSLLCAACLTTSLAFAYQTLAAARVPARAPHTQSAAMQTSMLHARVLLISGRFELNVAFTPDGQIHCFHISSVPAKANAGCVEA
ncbi:MAG: hypothetical protein LC802_08690 [Acidobacteria bacterium]|nr:hypothetical protein [Acidobacteriota bacterium]